MKNISLLIFEILITGLFLVFGLSQHKFLGIQGPRPAAIILSIIGLLLCTISVGKFISAAPANPLSIIGYIVGTIAMLVFLTQLFRWNLPIIGEPRTALIILAAAIIIKSVAARFCYLLTK